MKHCISCISCCKDLNNEYVKDLNTYHCGVDFHIIVDPNFDRCKLYRRSSEYKSSYKSLIYNLVKSVSGKNN